MPLIITALPSNGDSRVLKLTVHVGANNRRLMTLKAANHKNEAKSEASGLLDDKIGSGIDYAGDGSNRGGGAHHSSDLSTWTKQHPKPDDSLVELHQPKH
ncbi:hypothetical protein FRX31_016195 [Thalictrum thalictroides]|uniref:Uncharacterized protein n=1 Tax=Thalictrum thalictroides TaxID=46969 RepID=A0A7J6WA91_THATH|nr:hypothetical protein FRX31_016195 [Thalictrum thalictroides]